MYAKRRLLLAALLIGLVAPSALAQSTINVLVVDETDGFAESLAVNAIVGLMKQQTDLFASVDAVITPVASPFDLPFLDNPNGKSYDLVVVAPKGVLSLGQIWLVTSAYPQNRPKLLAAMDFLGELTTRFGAQFGLSLKLLDVSQDLFVGLLSGFFTRIGVL